uniref:Cat eye syndrome critical region protein 2 n=1 Tax=Aceria tosichella TaxID=561515 RepID=A0A6G1SHN3_9ACAR
MEEVRSHWQVASIQHFCTLFQKPFKLPSFQPEELEQAFVVDLPEPPKNNNSLSFSSIINQNHDDNNDTNNERLYSRNGDDHKQNGTADNDHEGDHDQLSGIGSRKSSSEHLSSLDIKPLPEQHQQQQPEQQNKQQPQNQQQQNEDQQELHLLVKLAIALLKPHFNSKISSANWENYLRRLIDVNWVELEKCPSPLSIPIISPDGIELSKSLNFRDLSLSDKLDIFFALCDYRLWCEDASELLKDFPLEELRLESIGKDSQGYEYWYFSGTRLYRENIEVSQDLICRKKRIKELEYKLIELEKARILKEQEEKRKAELERAKQLAQEAREARLAAKRQQDQEAAASSNATKRKRSSNTPVLPPRTGLRERRSSAAGNNTGSSSPATPSRTLRSRTKPSDSQTEQTPSQSAPKTTRNSTKNSKQSGPSERSRTSTPEGPKKSSEEECREELESIAIKQDERNEAWSIACESLEEWENFAKKFEKTKSINEKYLSRHLNDVLLPHIQGIYAKRAAEMRRKERERERELILAHTARRVSTRIISKRAQEEEEERQAKLREIEIQKKKAEAEIKLRTELEREMRAKQNRFVVNGTCDDGDDTSGRYNLRQYQHDTRDESSEFDGIIHPDKLAEFYEALELIVDTVRTSKHAWPFVNAVPDTVPGYYDLIKEPMDLKTLRTKVEFRHYKSLIELEKDFQLLVNNCERFNGPKNIYTKMVYKLWKSFRKNVHLYLERDLHMDEYETFLYPPQPPQQPNPPAPPPEQTSLPNQESHPTPDPPSLTPPNPSPSPDHQNHQQQPSQAQPQAQPQPQAPPPPPPPSPPHPITIPQLIEDDSEIPPEPVCEEVIVESYAEPCPDDISVVYQPDSTDTNQFTDK